MKRVAMILQVVKVKVTVIIFTIVLLTVFISSCVEDPVLMPELKTLKV